MAATWVPRDATVTSDTASGGTGYYPPMPYYFAYGALMGTSSMYEACPDARKVGPARLGGFRIEFNVASRQPDVTEEQIELLAAQGVRG